MKILLTGATGNMGSMLAKRLLGMGYAVAAIKRSTSDMGRVRTFANEIHWYDVDEDGVSAVFAKEKEFSCVIHMATCYGKNKESHKDIMRANYEFPFQVLEESVRSGVPVFFNTDTVLPSMLNMYSFTKDAFRRMGQYFSEHGGIKFINLRIGHMYGHMDNSYQFIPFLLYNCLANADHIDLTAGVQQLDFVHVNDVVDAFVTAITAREHMLQTYDVGSGELTTVRELAEMIKEFAGAQTELKFGALPYRKHEMMVSDINIAPLKRLGYCPRVTLREGLADLIEKTRAECKDG